jgi:hypothetical protein
MYFWKRRPIQASISKEEIQDFSSSFFALDLFCFSFWFSF